MTVDTMAPFRLRLRQLLPVALLIAGAIGVLLWHRSADEPVPEDVRVWNTAVTPDRMLGLLGQRRIPYPAMLAFSIGCCRLIRDDLDERQASILASIARKGRPDAQVRQDASDLMNENRAADTAHMSRAAELKYWSNAAIIDLLQEESAYVHADRIMAHDADLLHAYACVASVIRTKYMGHPEADPPPAELFEAEERMAALLRQCVPDPHAF